MDDLISREELLSELRSLRDTAYNHDSLIYLSKAVSDFIEMVARHPSAQQWTPLTQKRPARKGMYIVTIINNIGDYITTTAYYSGVEGYEWDGKKVTAWAELPEPYRGEK